MSDDERRESDDEPFNPAKRELCPDGMCTGVLGPDGRCKVCGRPGAGGAKAADPDGAVAPKAAAVERPAEEWRPRAVPGAVPGAGEAAAADHPDWVRERVPCADGMCTGIIGRNGRCGTCGRPWSGPR